MKNYYEHSFELRYFEVNKFGEATPTTILTLLEETAAEHCLSINHSLKDLQEQNIGWLLVSGIINMDRYPIYKEKITIRTWLSSYSTVKGFRENIIYDAGGNIIGRAKGLWVFFDILKRRPIQIFDSIKEKWPLLSEESIEHNIVKKITPVTAQLHDMEFKVNRFDIDAYGHVNNIRYLQWLLESIPDDIMDNYYLHTIDGRFIHEANFGDIILPYNQPDEIENSYLHTIKTQADDKVCATAKTIWKKRG